MSAEEEVKRDDELVFNHAQNVVGRLEEQNKALEEALRIACLDAWPDNPHWPDLYLKKARSNIDVAARAALQQAGKE